MLEKLSGYKLDTIQVFFHRVSMFRSYSNIRIFCYSWKRNCFPEFKIFTFTCPPLSPLQPEFQIFIFYTSSSIVSYLRFVMWQPVQRSAIKDIIPVERSLRILAKWVTPVAHLQRFLATIRVRALSSTADRVPANLPNNFLYLLNQNVMLLRLNESSWHRNRHKPCPQNAHIFSRIYYYNQLLIFLTLKSLSTIR